MGGGGGESVFTPADFRARTIHKLTRVSHSFVSRDPLDRSIASRFVCLGETFDCIHTVHSEYQEGESRGCGDLAHAGFTAKKKSRSIEGSAHSRSHYSFDTADHNVWTRFHAALR